MHRYALVNHFGESLRNAQQHEERLLGRRVAVSIAWSPNPVPDSPEGFARSPSSNTDTSQMLRTVIVEQKSSQSGRRKTITRTLEHELNSSDQARLDKSDLNKHSKQASLISETFKPRA